MDLGNAAASREVLDCYIEEAATFTMSGCAVMICSAGASFTLPLYFKSPMARDRLRFPFTLHS